MERWERREQKRKAERKRMRKGGVTQAHIQMVEASRAKRHRKLLGKICGILMKARRGG